MYKKRFAAWELRKNYSAGQKQQIMSRLASGSKHDVAKMRVNGQPLRLDRLKRPVQRRGRLLRLSSSNHDAVKAATSTNTFAVFSEPASSPRTLDQDILPALDRSKAVLSARLQRSSRLDLPQVLLYQSSSFQKVEEVLTYARCYYDWYFKQGQIDRNYPYDQALAGVFEAIRIGRHFMPENLDRAFNMFQNACQNVRQMLVEQPFQFLNQMMIEFLKQGWSIHPKVRKSLLWFIYRMAEEILGCGHPLTLIPRLLLDYDTLQIVAPKAIGLASEEVSKNLGQADKETLRIELESVNSHLQIDDVDGAERRAKKLSHLGRQNFGDEFWINRRAIEKIGWIRFSQGKMAEARLFCLHVLQLTIQSKGAPNGDGVGVEACQILGRICIEAEDFGGAE